MTDPRDLSDRLRLLVWDYGRRLRLEANPQSDLTWTQQAVMRRLYETPRMTGAELARADQVRPQSMSTTVAGLKKLGFVDSERGSADARRQELFLTELGRESIERVWGLRDAWLQEQIAATLDETRRGELDRGLEILRELLEAAPRR